MVERGCVDKGKKLSPIHMQEQLQLRHPSRYDIPSVHNINSFVISCLWAARKKAKEVTAGAPQGACPNAAQVEGTVRNDGERSTGNRCDNTAGHGTELTGECATGNKYYNTSGQGTELAMHKEGEGTAQGSGHENCNGDEGEGSGKQINVDMPLEQDDAQDSAMIENITDQAPDAVAGAGKRYNMPSTFAKCIETIVRADGTVKPRFVVGKMLISLGIQEEKKPPKFPTSAQVARKVGAVKKKLKKGHAKG